ncbi:MAG: hypothetical protein J7576_24200 [Siphonobacter aquaeclarae]|nr:hypothetical protein [Siphonobacter aquaeclarae]
MTALFLAVAAFFGGAFALFYARYEQSVRARTGSLFLTVLLFTCILLVGVGGLIAAHDWFVNAY